MPELVWEGSLSDAILCHGQLGQKSLAFLAYLRDFMAAIQHDEVTDVVHRGAAEIGIYSIV